MIGRAISHYRVLETLGAGGMGVVYLAEDGRLGRQVALKFLPPEASRDETTLERFRLEARAASSLSHPGICTVFDIGDDDGSPFIVMEALKGETLRDRIKRAPITVSDVLDLAIQLADALDAAHSQGIVHRDIKPGNIFIGDKNRVKILDFGLAKLVQTANATATMSVEDQLTMPGSTLGTVSYMSPEQARGEEVDARSDLFSLGTVIYEMAAGVQAFGGSTPGAVIAAILIRPAASIVERNASIPPRLEEIIGRALEKDRDLRYQHAGDLLADLKRLRRDIDLNPSLSSMSAMSRSAVPSMSPTMVATRIVPTPLPDVLPASNPSVAPAAPAGRGFDWRYGAAAGAAVVVIALAIAWPWHRPDTAAPSTQAVTPAAGTTAPAASASSSAPSPARAPTQLEPTSPPPVAAPAASPAAPPATSATRQAGDPRSSAPSRAQPAAQPVAPPTTRGSQAALPAVAEAPAAPPPQIAPSAQGPPLSGVPLANGALPAPPPAAAAPRTAPAPHPETPAPTAAAESDDAAIRRTIATYAAAVEKKDVALFRSVRPGLSAAEEARLRDSFKQIESQQVTLDIEDIKVDGRAATVRIARTDNLVVGGRKQTQSRQQVVRLEKTGAGWVISAFN